MHVTELQNHLFVVIGCGSIGCRHIRNLQSLGVRRLVAVETDRRRRDQVSAEFGIQTLERLEEVWELRPTVALVCTPTSMHVPMAMQAAERGLHLFVEKPLSDTRENIQHLLHLVKDRRLVSLVGCNMRFQPGLIKIKSMVDRGVIGRVVSARGEVGQYLPDWHPEEDYRHSHSASHLLGGGVILDAIHELDYLRWLMGEIASVSCFAGKLSLLEIETEDTAALLIRFCSGAIGELHLDYVQRAYSRSCVLIGDQGTIRWDYGRGEVRWFSARKKQWQVWRNPKGWQQNDMYVNELRHFFRCLEGAAQPAQDVFEAARVLEIALAVKAASESHVVSRV